MDTLFLILLLQVLTTWTLLGILWFMQLVHYPLFKRIKENFVKYEKEHLKRTAAFLVPLLVIDFALNVMLVISLEKGPYTFLISFALAMNIITWLSAFFFQIEQHQTLSTHFSKSIVHKLVKTNWVSTIAWTIKSALVCALIIAIHVSS